VRAGYYDIALEGGLWGDAKVTSQVESSSIKYQKENKWQKRNNTRPKNPTR